MKILRLSILFGAWVAFAGCGGGSGSSKGTGGSGGGAATGIGGSGGNGGSTAVGGSGGSDRSDGGSKNADTAPTSADAWVADVAQSGLKGDLASEVGSCPAFTPCGGDLVGTWYPKSVCAPTSSESLPGCVIAAPVTDKSGTKASYTFGSDSTVTVSLSGTFDEIIRYSASCLGGDAGAAQTCAAFQQRILQAAQASADAGQPGFTLEKFECSADSSQACSCDAVYAYVPYTKTGTYTTTGNQITFKGLDGSDSGLADAGASQPMDYCVSGNTLTLGSSATGTFQTLTK
jgi:hypothetical protein